MTVHSTLTGASVWPADLVTAGVVADASHVYAGRRPQQIRHDVEVWLEQLPTEDASQSGLQIATRHPYMVHVIRKGNDGPGRRGARNLNEVEGHLHTIRQRYHGLCPFLSAVSGMVHAEAVVEEVDDDPEETKAQIGTVRVTFTVAE